MGLSRGRIVGIFALAAGLGWGLALQPSALAQDVAGSEDADAADAEPEAPALPPSKQFEGKFENMIVTRDGSGLAVVVSVGGDDRNLREVWLFDADESEGRMAHRASGHVVDLAFSPSGKFLLIHSSSTPFAHAGPDVVEGQSWLHVASRDPDHEDYEIPVERGGLVTGTFESGPGPSDVTVRGLRTAFTRNLETGEQFQAFERIEPVSFSLDGSIVAQAGHLEIRVTERAGGELLLHLDDREASRDDDGYDERVLIGLNGDGSFLAVCTQWRPRFGKPGKQRVEGFSLEKQRRMWKKPLGLPASAFVVGDDYLAFVENGRLKTLDFVRGARKSVKGTPRDIVKIAGGVDRAYVWAGCKSGEITPVAP